MSHNLSINTIQQWVKSSKKILITEGWVIFADLQLPPYAGATWVGGSEMGEVRNSHSATGNPFHPFLQGQHWKNRTNLLT